VSLKPRNATTLLLRDEARPLDRVPDVLRDRATERRP
jgi:hypothetical protein